MIQIHETYRIYKSKKEVIEALKNNRDFRVNDFKYGFGMATSREDLLHLKEKEVKVRYNKLQDVVLINLETLKEIK
jgi:hypothetical protein